MTNRKKPSTHVSLCLGRARSCLSRLEKFKPCLHKVKKKLNQSLVQPLIDYPCVQLYNSGVGNISKLQKIQNKALRYINNSTLNDRISSKSLHEKYKIKPINLRLKKLAYKSLSKLLTLYKSSNNEDQVYTPYYKLNDYTIDKTPHFNKKQSLLDKIIDKIWQKNHDPIFTLPDNIDDWGNNNPIYL